MYLATFPFVYADDVLLPTRTKFIGRLYLIFQMSMKLEILPSEPSLLQIFFFLKIDTNGRIQI